MEDDHILILYCNRETFRTYLAEDGHIVPEGVVEDDHILILYCNRETFRTYLAEDGHIVPEGVVEDDHILILYCNRETFRTYLAEDGHLVPEGVVEDDHVLGLTVECVYLVLGLSQLCLQGAGALLLGAQALVQIHQLLQQALPLSLQQLLVLKER